MHKIAFFNVMPHEKEFYESANERCRLDITYFDFPLNIKTCSYAKGFDAICVFVNDLITADIIDALYQHKVRLIALRSAGYNHIDLRAASGKLKVVRVPDYSPYSVAEHAVAMMLALNRKIHIAYSRVRENNFSITGLIGFVMNKKTAGVIGAGRVGKAAIQILKGFGMNVIAYDIDPEQVKIAECPFVDLDTLYRESDIITIHCPLTPQNKHMVDSGAIAKMKDGVMIINTGRGALIKSEDLLQALEMRKIGSAGLDVLEEEGNYFYKDLSSTFIDNDVLARLLTFPNVLITSHQAFFTKEAMEAIARVTLANVKDFYEGKPLKNEISASSLP